MRNIKLLTKNKLQCWILMKCGWSKAN